MQFEEPMALQVVVNAKVADHLVGKPDGLHIDELGKLTQIDPKKLGRLLRMLATKHCFQEGELLPRLFLAAPRLMCPLHTSQAECLRK